MKHAYKLTLSTHSLERLAQLKQLFPKAAGENLRNEWRGGRAMALKRLAQVDASTYARERNHLEGAVTHLSPYLRHGCLSLHETIADVRTRFGVTASKLISELAYRDYFRQVWSRFGEAILQHMEPAKVSLGHQSLPAYIAQRFTGLVCMDAIVRDLQQQGYVHNHARLWFAAYVVHWLKVDWREAADWFERQLLDGDMASNHLSWQWVASTFSQKPYFFNRDNIMKFGGEDWCRQCQVACPFDDTYEQLEQQLFTRLPPSSQTSLRAIKRAMPDLTHVQPEWVWVHDEMLSAQHPLLQRNLPAVFVFDLQLYGHWSLKRLQFMADCLAEMPQVQVWVGPTPDILQQLTAGTLITQATPQIVLQQCVQGLSIQWQPEAPLTTIELNNHDLMRFSRYWKKMAPALLGDTERS